MNNRVKSRLIVLGLCVVAVPTIGAARTHYTGKVPASIVLTPVPTPPTVTAISPAHTARTASHRKGSSHRKAAVKKKLATKHSATQKYSHKLTHKKSKV